MVLSRGTVRAKFAFPSPRLSSQGSYVTSASETCILKPVKISRLRLTDSDLLGQGQAEGSFVTDGELA
jgi:hypothetical protein